MKSRIRKREDMEFNSLLGNIRSLVISSRKAVVRNIDTIQVLTNFGIGQVIVKYEQAGKKRAEYGQKVLSELCVRLSKEFGRGFSEKNLYNMRKFYITYRDQRQISQTVSGKLPFQVKRRVATDVLNKSETVSRKSSTPRCVQAMHAQFALSWPHYVFLMSIDNQAERDFYEIEAKEQNWSLRELKRQFNSGLYERLSLSRDKKGIKKLSKKGQIIEKPQDMLKSPYVLEFLGLDEKAAYSESDLECAIIDKIEHFLLELGKGFLFEARQKRFTFNEEHFYVDLVFYNRLLRCYVLIDLKIGKLTHQTLGQMQMYVNYFDRYVKRPDENPSVGIILCRKKHDALVEITLPKDDNIHASEYQLYLPSKEELRRKLMEWSEQDARCRFLYRIGILSPIWDRLKLRAGTL